MEIREFVKTLGRMCNYYGYCSWNCPIKSRGFACPAYQNDFAEVCNIVEKWSEENPQKTRQSVFLEQYPNAKVRKDGTLIVCPQDIDVSAECRGTLDCKECCKEYWGDDVE